MGEEHEKGLRRYSGLLPKKMPWKRIMDQEVEIRRGAMYAAKARLMSIQPKGD